MMMKNGDDDRSRQEAGPNARPKATDAGLRSRQRVIGAGLKRLFEDVVDESVPDDFLALLAKFDESDPPRGGGDGR